MQPTNHKMKTRLIWITLLCTFMSHVYAQENITVNGLFSGKAIIVVNGNPVMFYEGDTRQGITLLSANENRAVLEIAGKKHTMLLDQSIANEYSKPIKSTRFSVAENIIHHIELVYQSTLFFCYFSYTCEQVCICFHEVIFLSHIVWRRGTRIGKLHRKPRASQNS